MIIKEVTGPIHISRLDYKLMYERGEEVLNQPYWIHDEERKDDGVTY